MGTTTTYEWRRAGKSRHELHQIDDQGQDRLVTTVQREGSCWVEYRRFGRELSCSSEYPTLTIAKRVIGRRLGIGE